MVLCDKCEKEFERSEIIEEQVTGGTMYYCKVCYYDKIKKKE